jgi:hypothetical protein
MQLPEFRILIAGLLAALLAGCGGERVHHLSGTVTFQGKPVPAGHIVFEPSAGSENGGSPAFAKIKDGRYDTRLEGQGTVGGPHTVLIHGRDGIPRGELLNGLPLFQDYSTTADLPNEEGTLDFEVPASAKQ